MTKKTYLRPTTNVVEVKIAQLVCATSLNRVTSTGLDKNETLDYGDKDGTTTKDVWGNAW